jgi:hypothetical protein
MAAQKSVARLALLYGMMERMRSVELRVAAGAVEDVACSAAIARKVRENQIAEGRAAMANGRREAWQVAETTRGVNEARIVRLAMLRAEREIILEQAVQVHRASRLNMEQMDRVVDRARTQAEMENGRRLQAESDDRFASRRAWLQTRQVDDSE